MHRAGSMSENGTPGKLANVRALTESRPTGMPVIHQCLARHASIKQTWLVLASISIQHVIMMN